MQVGDLVKENPDNALFYGETFGIIIDVDSEIATVAWVCHPVFGTHENYCTAKELIFFNKNLLTKYSYFVNLFYLKYTLIEKKFHIDEKKLQLYPKLIIIVFIPPTSLIISK